ncbi:MAG: sodium-dependent bicarbonate transport family permease, partial [Alphaproteobacteria bacterium]|nr:sodium-dependent bicarbonate transport family permease [Alphaproteobacteria bacterium]
GSISIVTYVAATAFLEAGGIPYEGHVTAMVALMETPAIVTGLLRARLGDASGRQPPPDRALAHEVLTNGAVVLLLGAFAIGWATGSPGMAAVAPFVDAPFKGVLCLFLLDMGLLVARRFAGSAALGPRLIAFGLIMPLTGAALGLATALALGMSRGGAALLATLAASASYIAVPAAMRLALPKANPSIYVSLSLGVTFPFNVSLGIPLYWAAADRLMTLLGR